MSESSEAKIKEIIVEQLGINIEIVTQEMKKQKPPKSFLEAKMIEDLGADSLDAVELVMAIEEEFKIEVPDEKAEKLQTIKNIIDHVEEALREKREGN